MALPGSGLLNILEIRNSKIKKAMSKISSSPFLLTRFKCLTGSSDSHPSDTGYRVRPVLKDVHLLCPPHVLLLKLRLKIGLEAVVRMT